MSFQHLPLGQEYAQPTSVNRRATVRYHCGPATPGRVVVAGKQELIRAWVLDISLGGVALLLPRPLEVGLDIILQMKGTAARSSCRLGASVAHVTQHVNGDWIIGCAFHEPLTRDQLDELL